MRVVNRMTIELGVLIAIIGIVISVATFFIGRITSAKNDASTITELKKDIEYLLRDVKYIRDNIENNSKKYDDSLRRVHMRIDEHERTYHNVSNQNKD